MSDIFLWFYCLPIGEVIILVGIATMAYIWIHERYWTSHVTKAVDEILLIGWLGVTILVTIGQRTNYETVTIAALQPLQSYREAKITGNIEIYRSNFMNVVLFYPAGLLVAMLLPRRWPGWCRCVLVAIVLAAMSAGIEFLQYRCCLGRCEIDDVIHNTLGALLGSLAALLLPPFFAFLKEKVKLK